MIHKISKFFDRLILLCIMALMLVISIIYLNKNNEFLNYNLINVLSSSMEDSEIYKDDILVIKYQDITSLEVGDIICFNISQTSNDNFELYDINNYDNLDEINYINKRVYNTTNLWIHEIVNIYIDTDLNIYYETKGTSNLYADTFLVKAHDIVGVYVCNVPIISTLRSFIISSTGIYLTIVLPITMMFMCIVFKIIKTNLLD